MSPNLTDDQLILLKQLGFQYGWIQCHLRQTAVIGSETTCRQCRKALARHTVPDDTSLITGTDFLYAPLQMKKINFSMPLNPAKCTI